MNLLDIYSQDEISDLTEIMPELVDICDNPLISTDNITKKKSKMLPMNLIKDISKAISMSKAKKIYVCNAMTQPGETDGYKVSDHIKRINEYLEFILIKGPIVSFKYLL